MLIGDVRADRPPVSEMLAVSCRASAERHGETQLAPNIPTGRSLRQSSASLYSDTAPPPAVWHRLAKFRTTFRCVQVDAAGCAESSKVAGQPRRSSSHRLWP